MLPDYEDQARRVFHMHRLCKITVQAADIQIEKEVGEEEITMIFDKGGSVSP